jgi:hypothetical protein
MVVLVALQVRFIGGAASTTWLLAHAAIRTFARTPVAVIIGGFAEW